MQDTSCPRSSLTNARPPVFSSATSCFMKAIPVITSIPCRQVGYSLADVAQLLLFPSAAGPREVRLRRSCARLVGRRLRFWWVCDQQVSGGFEELVDFGKKSL